MHSRTRVPEMREEERKSRGKIGVDVPSGNRGIERREW